MSEPKVFGIGLSKTATTSLNAALNQLGYRSAHYPIMSMTYHDVFPQATRIMNAVGYKFFNRPLGIYNYRLKEPYIDLTGFEHYDAFTDIPISFCYRQLDQMYPGSKFILTVRELNPWLLSCKRHVSNPYKLRKPEWWHEDEMGSWNKKSMNIVNRLNYDVYGSVVFDKAKFIDAYNRHEDEVRKYFLNRDQDLLIIDITRGEGWEKLCPFLDKAVPVDSIPEENVTA